MSGNTPNLEMPIYLREAVSAFSAGNPSESLRILEAARLADPRNVKILNNLGVFAAKAERIEFAIRCFREAIELDGSSFEAWLNLGLLLRDKRDSEDARHALEKASALRPDSVLAATALGFVLISLKEKTAARPLLERAAELDPETSERWSNLGNLLTEMREFASAQAALERSLRLAPGNIQARYNMATLDYQVGDVEAASREFDAIVADNPDGEILEPLRHRYLPHISNAAYGGRDLRKLGEAISNAMQRPALPLFKLRPRGAKLRIAFLSADFRDHSCAFFLRPLFENWDRRRYELHCFASFAENPPDETTEWFAKNATAWHDTTGMTIQAIAADIAAFDFDILFDLGGYTGGSLSSVCAYRPALAIAAWLGFPGSTGMPEIGYRIGDAVADPIDGEDGHFSEKIIRVNGPFLCYAAPHDAPAVAPAPAAISGAPIFGSFNNPHKIRLPVAEAWTRIVTAVPNSKLLIKAPLTGEPYAGTRLRKMFADCGLAPDRLIIIDGHEKRAAHLAAFARIDISLDPFPYNGTTSTCESIWMGVPVVALAGTRHSARVGASLLRHIGLDELVAADLDEYIEKAVALGRDFGRLDAYRKTLRARFQASPLMDGRGWTRNFEKACEQIYSDSLTALLAADREKPRQSIENRPVIVAAALAEAEALLEIGDEEGCFAILGAAHDTYPDSENLLYGLAHFSKMAGRVGEAISYFKETLKLQETNFDAWLNLGILLREDATLEESQAALERAVAINPGSALALTALASVAIGKHDKSTARSLLERAAELEPYLSERWSNLGSLLARMREIGPAATALDRALQIEPANSQARFSLATLYEKSGDFEAAIENYERVRDASDMSLAVRARASLCFFAISDPNVDGKQLKALAEQVLIKLARPPKPLFVTRQRKEKLRIGFLSADFRRHSCAYFLMPLFENWDRQRYEFHCFAEFNEEVRPDPVSQWFAVRATNWFETERLTPMGIAAAIADAQIDVLFELGGYSGASSIAATIYQPAPAIVSWLGFPGSTAIPEIGYRLGDAVVDPLEISQDHFSERIEHINGPFLCFSRPSDAPDESPPPSMLAGFPTFGSFNSAHKIHPKIAAAWTRIVQNIPNAKLLLKIALSAQPKAEQRLRSMFAAAGLPCDRLILVDTYANTRDHLGAYGRIDVALDPFPYNGTTTTCEALWMGVPVVTFAGSRHSARVGASILGHIGLDELVATDLEDYVAKAIALATDRERLVAYRGTLRKRLESSPLMDGPAWTRRFEATIEKIFTHATNAVPTTI